MLPLLPPPHAPDDSSSGSLPALTPTLFAAPHSVNRSHDAGHYATLEDDIPSIYRLSSLNPSSFVDYFGGGSGVFEDILGATLL